MYNREEKEDENGMKRIWEWMREKDEKEKKRNV